MAIPVRESLVPTGEGLLHAATGTVTRPAAIDDLAAVNALHARCSLQTLHERYLGARSGLRPAEWHALNRPGTALTWVTHPVTAPDTLIAVVHIVRAEGDGAELGVLVEDVWQSRRLGTALAGHALHAVAAVGATSLTAVTHAANTRMVRILRGLDASFTRGDGAEIEASVPVRAPSAHAPRR